MDDTKRVKLLKDVKKLLDENNIEFFPIYGTLLGFVRDGHIMPWDVDIDLGAWYQDYNKIINLRDSFEKLGYKLTGSGLTGKYCHINICPIEDFAYYSRKKYTEEWKVYEANRIKNNLPVGYDVPFHAGISFWAKDKDKAVQLKFYDNNMFYRTFGKSKKNSLYDFFATFYRALVLFINEHEVLPSSWFENMETISVYALDFKVPSNYEQYLSTMYGTNWKIPDKTWSKEKHLKFNGFLTKYQIKDKNIRDLWIKREDVGDE